MYRAQNVRRTDGLASPRTTIISRSTRVAEGARNRREFELIVGVRLDQSVTEGVEKDAHTVDASVETCRPSLGLWEVESGQLPQLLVDGVIVTLLCFLLSLGHGDNKEERR